MLRHIAAAAIATLAAHAVQAQNLAERADPSPIGNAHTRSSLPVGTHRAAYTAEVAKAVIEARGYREVKNLSRDPVGNWAGEAVRDTLEVAVILQVNGEIAEE